MNRCVYREEWIATIIYKLKNDLFYTYNRSYKDDKYLNFPKDIYIRFYDLGKKTAATCSNIRVGGYDECRININIDSDSIDSIAHLIHELIHAYVWKYHYVYNKNPHQGLFPSFCKHVGLNKPYRQTTPNKELKTYIKNLLDIYGEQPELFSRRYYLC